MLYPIALFADQSILDRNTDDYTIQFNFETYNQVQVETFCSDDVWRERERFIARDQEFSLLLTFDLGDTINLKVVDARMLG